MSRNSPNGEMTTRRERGTLPELADQINTHHTAAAEAIGTTLEHARAAGVLLAAAKAQMPHGEWTAWLDAHFDGSARTARLYMRLARRWEDLPKTATPLPIREAVRLLAEPDSPSRFDELSAKVQAAREALRAVELPPGWGLRGRAGPWWAVVRPSERPGLFYVASGFDRPDGSALVEETPEPVPLEEAPFFLVARETPEPFPFGRVAWDPFAFEGQAPAGPTMQGGR
jgi:hypothetical protein